MVPKPCAAARCVTCACCTVAGRLTNCSTRGNGGGGDCLSEAPSANTCSSLEMPPFDDVGVPPTVIARYSLPSIEYTDGPAAIW